MRALVTGGGGFLGKAVVQRLLARDASVRSLSRGLYPELERIGVNQIQGDLADAAAVDAAVKGCDTVFHVAARAGVWGDYESFFKPNVLGTLNIINACRRFKVKRLIYTSSPSVTFDGSGQEGVDERAPYPSSYLANYPATKAEAEQMVIAANGPDMATVSLRPHLIWGPEDNHLVPRILDRGKKGALRLVGDGRNLVDTVYIDNAADAHLQAAEHLFPNAACAGKSYFITNDEPLPMADIINRILAAGGQSPVKRKVPSFLAYLAGGLAETVYNMLGKDEEPRITRFVALQLGTPHWFDISAAKRDFGYVPTISIDEGMKRLARWLEKTQ